MSKLSNQYKKFMKDLEENIENKEDYEYIKNEISKLFIMFINEIDEMKEIHENKINAILERQTEFNEKIIKIENALNNIQKDIYMEDIADFEILCPYCNKEFVIQLDELRDEVECPECNNTIELDWNDSENDCGEGCPGCGHHNHYDEDDDL